VATILALYPGLPLGNPAVVALMYALKQVDAVLWGLCQNIKHKIEGAIPRLQDISVYAKLAAIMIKETTPKVVEHPVSRKAGSLPIPPGPDEQVKSW